MGGRGPVHKASWERARRTNPWSAERVYDVEAAPQPQLPDCRNWPAETVEWLRLWGESALAGAFKAMDWSELMDTVWSPRSSTSSA